jgi:hypothetical protein
MVTMLLPLNATDTITFELTVGNATKTVDVQAVSATDVRTFAWGQRIA